MDGRSLYIYFLFEHKSFPDYLTAFQLLRYQVKIWSQELREEKGKSSLTPIIPLVVYHGRSPWQVSLHFNALFNAPAELHQYLPDFQYTLHDLTIYDDADIRGKAALQAMLLLLKYIFNENLAERLPTIFTLLRELAQAENDLAVLYTVIRYVTQSANQVTEAELKESIRTTFKDGDTLMSTIAERWIEQGLEQGLEQGQLETAVRFIMRLLQRRFQYTPPNLAQRLAELPLDELDTLLDTALEVDSIADFLTHLPPQS